jgi:cytochrome P450
MWGRARREAPVFYSDDLRVWTVTRYEDVRKILTDYKIFSNRGTVGGFEIPEKYRSRFPDGLWSNHTLINRDPPSHTRAKKLAQKAFTPRRVAAMEPSMRELTNALVDRVADAGRANLMTDYANPFTIHVIAGILGIPDQDVDRLRQATEDVLVLLTPGHPDEDGIVHEMPKAERLERFERFVEFDDYLRAVIEDRRRDARDDVISGLVHAEEEGQPSLTNDEVAAIVTEQVVAGNDTSANMIGHAVLYLRREPGLWEEVLANREMLPAVVEETVRRHTPSKGLFRRTTRPVRLSGVDIPEGALLHVLWGSANTDEEKFENPLRFDPHRPNLSEHVGFGRGTHYCLGAPLAKLQGRIALGTLLDRLPDLDVVPNQQLRYAPALTNVSLMGLEVRWTVPGLPTVGH